MEGYGSTGIGAMQRRVVEERKLITGSRTFIYIGNFRETCSSGDCRGRWGLDLLYIEWRRGVLTAPAYLFSLESATADAAADSIVVTLALLNSCIFSIHFSSRERKFSWWAVPREVSTPMVG